MEVVKRCWKGVRLLLMWESAAAGLFFLAIAITAMVSPASVKAVESLDCFARAQGIVEGCLPVEDPHTLFVVSSFAIGAFNALVALVALMRRR